jgi:hypothetical protein
VKRPPARRLPPTRFREPQAKPGSEMATLPHAVAFARLRLQARFGNRAPTNTELAQEFGDLAIRAHDPVLADIVAFARSPFPEIDDEPYPPEHRSLHGELTLALNTARRAPIRSTRRRTIRVRPAERVALTADGRLIPGGYQRVEAMLAARQLKARRAAATARPRPLPASPHEPACAPAGGTAAQQITAIAAAAIRAVTTAETARRDDRQVSRLTTAIERLASRPTAPINVTVQPPALHLAAAPVNVAAPQVHVTVEAPRARVVRVEEDNDGNRRFIPEEP